MCPSRSKRHMRAGSKQALTLKDSRGLRRLLLLLRPLLPFLPGFSYLLPALRHQVRKLRLHD